MTHYTDEMETPSYYADRDPSNTYSCASRLGPLNSDAPWAMYSFDRPAYTFWDGVAAALYRRGWTDEEIKTWLQSSEPRHALDGNGALEAIEAIGALIARSAEKVETR